MRSTAFSPPGGTDPVSNGWKKTFQPLEKRASLFPMSGKYNYLFGPVPSRRLGRSLGIDVTPLKTCSTNCIFCQCGCTTCLSSTREEFVPFEAVCAEVEKWLSEDGAADFITFAGSGEPTLYSRLGELIDFIKSKTKIPLMVLSNGTLLHQAKVRDELLRADVVKISLSAWDEDSFQRINRPASGVRFDMLRAGERAFRKAFAGQLWLEVFLMEGVNADPGQVEQIAVIAKEIRPDKIHLNTAVRPPAEAEAQPVEKEKLEAFCDLFSPRAEIIASFEAAAPTRLSDAELVGLIKRHPATALELAAIVGGEIGAIKASLAPFLASGELQTEDRNGETYYK